MGYHSLKKGSFMEDQGHAAASAAAAAADDDDVGLALGCLTLWQRHTHAKSLHVKQEVRRLVWP